MKRSSGSPLTTVILMDELQKLTIRVTQLEIAVFKLITIQKDQSDAVRAAANLPMHCETCGNDITVMDTCDKQPCQWGFPALQEVTDG